MLVLQQQAEKYTQDMEREAKERDAVVRQAEERVAQLERCAQEREAALLRQVGAAEERALELQKQLEHNQHEQALLRQEQAGKYSQDLEREARERDAIVRQAEEWAFELEHCAQEREAALRRQVGAAEERAQELQKQLEQLRHEQAEKYTQDLKLEVKKCNAVMRQAEDRVFELERCAQEREAALRRQVEAAEERTLEIQKQLERAQQAASVMDIVLRL